MANNYPDLSKPLNQDNQYPDLSKPIASKQDIGRQIMDANNFLDPFEVIKSGLLGMGRGGENIASTLTRGYAPKVMDDVTKMVGGSKNPVAELAGQYAPLIAMGPQGLLGNVAAGSGYTALQNPEHPVAGALAGAGLAIAPEVISSMVGATKALARPFINAFKPTGKLGEAAERAATEHAAAEQAANEAETASLHAVEKSDPELMQGELNKNKSTLAGLQQPEVSNLPIPSSQESAANLENAKLLHQNNIKNLSNTENKISKHLNQGASHDVDLASQLVNKQEGIMQPNGKRIGGIRSNISKGYDDVIDNLKNQNVEIGNSEDLQGNIDKLNELSKQGKYSGPEAQDLLKKINQVSNNEPTSIPADKYLTMLRSAKDYARVARKNAFTPDMNAEEREMWKTKFNDLDDQIENMESNFTDSIDKNDADKLKDLNTSWRNLVKPLQRNSTYQTILHRGRIEGNIVQKLRGTDPGDVLMRTMIKGDPEMLKNAVGQKHASNPDDLHNAGALVNEYTNNMPELQNMINQHAVQKNAINESKNALNDAEISHKAILDQEEKAQSLSQSQRNKASKIEQKRAALQQRNDLLDKHIANLRQVNARHDISLEQKVKTGKELDKAIAAKTKARKQLAWLGGSAAFSYPGYKLLKTILSNVEGD